jgi:hypothetical protein
VHISTTKVQCQELKNLKSRKKKQAAAEALKNLNEDAVESEGLKS